MADRRNSSLYGSGVFTTVAVEEGSPVLWEKHWARLSTNAAAIGIDPGGFTSDSILSELESRLAAAEIRTGKARITFFDESSTPLWPGEQTDVPTRLGILVRERRAKPRDFRLGISPFPINSRSPLVGIKSCNYLEPILSKREAGGRGFDEAVRVSERGFVAGGCMANVFWSKGDRLFTPSLSTGCLPGTTREYVLENTECEEVEAEIGELDKADSIFLTSAGLGVVEVAVFEGRRLSSSDNAILSVLPF